VERVASTAVERFGGGGLLISLMGKMAPRITDLAMEKAGVEAQQKRGDPGDAAARDNLYEPRSDGRLDGTQSVHVRRSSLLFQAQTRPMALPFHAAAAGMRTALRLASAARHRTR
jgi:hypothetical protein